MYSIIPINVKRNGSDTLNPSLIGSMLLVNISSDVVTITTLDIVTTMLVQSVKSNNIMRFAISDTPPIDKLKDFILLVFFFDYCCVGGIGGVLIGGCVTNNPANAGICDAAAQFAIPCVHTRVSLLTDP